MTEVGEKEGVSVVGVTRSNVVGVLDVIGNGYGRGDGHAWT